MNLARKSIEFGEAIHRIYNEFLHYFIEIYGFKKEIYWIWKRTPYNLVGIPSKLNRHPLILKENLLNLARKSIEFGEAIHRIYKEFL